IDPSRPPVEQMLAELHARGIQSLLVEGGACILRSFIDSGLYDDVRIEHSTIILNEGVRAPLLPSC
ncbi:dihydrofolate reductase family protein, partial [Porphyromonas gingivalis]